MPQLRKIAYSKIGHKRARLDGLTINFSSSDTPTDTILWGDNGSGKTSALQLFFALFHPQKQQFLGNSGDGTRSFDLYFNVNDLAFVVSEWEDYRVPGDFTTRQIRIVGRCIQKIADNERKSADYSPGCFFTFIADDEVNLDTLPLTQNVKAGRAQFVRSPKQFKEWFDDKFRDKHELGAKLIRDNIREWKEHVSSVGFDLDIMELLMHLNHGEGATGGFTEKFGNDEAFVKFLTGLLIDEDGGELTRKLIGHHRADLREEPLTRRKLEFDTKLYELVSDMATDANRLIEAEKTEESAREDASVTHARLIVTAEEAKEKRLEKERSHQALKSQHEAKIDTKNTREANNYWLELQAGKLGETETKIIQTLELDAKDVADRKKVIAESLISKAEFQGIEEIVKSLDMEIARRQTTTLPFLQSAHNAGALYGQMLTTEKEKAEGLLKIQLSSLKEKNEDKDAKEKSQRQAIADLSKANTKLEGLQEQDKARLDSLVTLRSSGMLDVEEGAVEGLARIDAELKELNDKKEEAESILRGAISTEATAKAAMESANKAEDEAKKELDVAKKRLANYVEDLEVISAHPALVELLQESDTVDPYARGIKHQCQTNHEQIRLNLWQIGHDIAAANDLLQEMRDNRGLVPPSRDVSIVIEALNKEKIRAFPYWHHFQENNCSEEKIADLLQKDPARYSGVAVHNKDDLKEAARAASVISHIKSPVQVSWYGAQDAAEESDRVIFTPDIPLLCDPVRAAVKKMELQSNVEDYEITAQRLREKDNTAKIAIETLDTFLAKHPESTGAKLKKAVEERESAQSEAVATHSNKKIQYADAVSRKEQLEVEVGQTKEGIRLVSGKRQRIADHVSKFEENAAERQKQITALGNETASIEQVLQTLGGQIQTVSEEIKTITDAIGELNTQKALYSDFIKNIKYSNGDPTAPVIAGTTSIEAARNHYEDAVREYDRQNDDATLIDLEARRDVQMKLLGSLKEAYAKKFSDITGEEQEKLQVAHVGSTPTDILSLTSKALSDATLAAGKAVNAHDVAKEALADAKRRTANKRLLPPEICPETKAEALEMAASAAEEVNTLQGEIHQLKSQIDSCLLELARMKGGIDVLSTILISAENICEPSVKKLQPYSTAEEAAEEWTKALTALETAERNVIARKNIVAKHTEKIRGTVYNDELSSADPETAQQFREKIDALYLECALVMEGLLDIIGSLQTQLDRFEDNKKDIINQLAFDCRDLIRKFESINEVSKLPNMGSFWELWEGKSFLKFYVPAEIKSEENIRLKLDEYLLHLVRNAKESIPAPEDLIFGALRCILGGKFTVSTLMPHATAITLDYYRISAKDGLGSWSGGERLTGAILFCLSLAELVRQHRNTIANKSDTGFLLLDNPFGTTTSQAFVNIQFALARRFKIQLLTTTNSKDTDILASFPKIIGIKPVAKDKDDNLYIGDATDTCPEIAEAILKRRHQNQEAVL